MPLPPSWSQIPVTATYTRGDGEPASGYVLFISPQVVIVDDEIIVPRSIRADLDETGSISVEVPSTDDPDIAPTGWTWTVREQVAGLNRAAYAIEVPHDSPGIDLADVSPVSPVDEVTDLLTSAQLGETVASVEQALRPRPGLPAAPVAMYWGGSDPSPFIDVGASGTVAEDTADFVLGTRSVVATTDGAGNQTAVGQFGGTAFDMTGRIPVVWLKNTANLDHVIDYKLWVGDTSFTNNYQWNLLEDPDAFPFLRTGEWTKLTLPRGRATITGTPNDAALTDIQIAIFDDNTSNQATVKWGGFATVPEPTAWSGGVVTIGFDDGLLSQYTTAKPIMDAAGFPGVAYLIANTVANPTAEYMSIAQARDLQDWSGWDIATHHLDISNTGYTNMTSSEQLDDMRAAKAFLQGQGFTATDHLSYPFGAYDQTVLANAHRLFTTGRIVGPSVSVFPNESIPAAEPLKLRSLAVIDTTPTSTITDRIDEAVAGGEWLILVFHGIVATPTLTTEYATADFQTVIDHLAANSVPVRTVSQVMGTPVA